MDFLGYVRIRVDRRKPLSEVPEVYLDRNARFDEWGDLIDVPGTLARLGLDVSDFRTECLEFVVKKIPVGECIVDCPDSPSPSGS